MADASDIPSRNRAPAPPGLAHVLRSYWWLILLPVIALGGVAIALGVSRSPEFQSQAELNVGQTDLATQALPGFQDGAVSLADSYSRVVQSQRITAPVARKLGVPQSYVEARLSAVPVPERTVFRIKGKGPTSRRAEQMVNIATKELQDYVEGQSRFESQSSRLLRSYRRAADRAQVLSARTGDLEQRDASPSEVRGARVDEATARLQASALAQQYQDARPTASGAAVQILDSADTAASDRSSVTQRYLAVAIILGLLIGVALALSASARAWRRAAITQA